MIRWKILLLTLLLLPAYSAQSEQQAADDPVDPDYDNQYCYDPVELARWDRILAGNPGSDGATTIHALWLGLCAKVGAKQITTSKANQIFDDMRGVMLRMFEEQEEKPEPGTI